MSCNFFFAVNARNKKTVTSCNFFLAGSHDLQQKKKVHDVTVFLVRAFTAEKKLHELQHTRAKLLVQSHATTTIYLVEVGCYH